MGFAFQKVNEVKKSKGYRSCEFGTIKVKAILIPRSYFIYFNRRIGKAV